MNIRFMHIQGRLLALATLLLCAAQAMADIPEGEDTKADGKKKEALKQAMKAIEKKKKKSISP